MSFEVRPATLADAARICEINRSALGYPSQLHNIEKQLAKILARPTDRVWVAYNAQTGVVAGFVHAADYETLHSGSMKNIISLAVDPAWQNHGLGRMLTETAEQWARDDRCGAIRLVSGMDRVDAHAFYRHCGYRLRKEQKNFIKDV